jgi:hypothetical protein
MAASVTGGAAASVTGGAAASVTGGAAASVTGGAAASVTGGAAASVTGGATGSFADGVVPDAEGPTASAPAGCSCSSTSAHLTVGTVGWFRRAPSSAVGVRILREPRVSSV